MTGCGVGSPSHWISRESGSTPLGRLTLHVSVYEVPVTPDPSPDTTHPNADTPMIKMMISERIPPTTEVNPASQETGCPK